MGKGKAMTNTRGKVFKEHCFQLKDWKQQGFQQYWQNNCSIKHFSFQKDQWHLVTGGIIQKCSSKEEAKERIWILLVIKGQWQTHYRSEINWEQNGWQTHSTAGRGLRSCILCFCSRFLNRGLLSSYDLSNVHYRIKKKIVSFMWFLLKHELLVFSGMHGSNFIVDCVHIVLFCLNSWLHCTALCYRYQ